MKKPSKQLLSASVDNDLKSHQVAMIIAILAPAASAEYHCRLQNAFFYSEKSIWPQRSWKNIELAISLGKDLELSKHVDPYLNKTQSSARGKSKDVIP